MKTDPVCAALRAAIAAKDSIELRVALGRHLLSLGAPGEALAEFDAALSLEPTARDALTAAAEAAAALGDEARARAYRLSAEATAPATPEPVPARREPSLRLRLATRDGKHVAPVSGEESPALRLDDVGGLDDIKTRLERAFLRPLRRPDLYRRFGKRIGGGLILYGPPGCGKTYIARALAGELGARFVSIGLSDVLDMWLGESERRLHELFEHARRAAPTLIFFDEIDALAQRRTHLKHSAGRTVVNQLLAELDGVTGENQSVFVLGATNHPWDVDPAVRRPGRFDCMLFVPPPDAVARERILSLHLAGRPTVTGFDLVAIAERADGCTGADLRAVVDLATDLAIERTLGDGGTDCPIDEGMLIEALESVRPSARPWFETARNYALYANEGGTYDDLIAYLRQQRLA